MKLNIYRMARDNANLTRERASELLDISTSSLKEYEKEVIKDEEPRRPSDEVVIKMMKEYNAYELGYKHLRSSPLGQMLLPEIEFGNIGLSTLKFLKEYNDIANFKKEIIEIASDGIVDEDELPRWMICKEGVKELLGASFGLICINDKSPMAVTTGL